DRTDIPELLSEDAIKEMVDSGVDLNGYMHSLLDAIR
ncbi:hypothetical protein KIPB_017297, partial [Kipferlia bialata]